LRIQPDHLDANNSLGVAFALTGELRNATNCFAKVLRLKPGFMTARENLGRAFLDLGDFAGAAEQYAEAGQLEKAVAAAQKACTRATTLGDTNLFNRSQELLRQYQNRQPRRARIEPVAK
jgi:tetratricopeptide (TPR) repeat protein